MILEERVKEVSNRSSQKNKKQQYSLEIDDAIQKIVDSYQESPKVSEGNVGDNKSPKEQQGLIDYQQDLDQLQEIYSLLEDQNTPQLDYQSLFSHLENKVKSKSTYQSEKTEERSAAMTDEEAKEIIQKIQTKCLLRNQDEIPPEEKERFRYWQEFNKALLMLYHNLSPLRNDNINYALAA